LDREGRLVAFAVLAGIRYRAVEVTSQPTIAARDVAYVSFWADCRRYLIIIESGSSFRAAQSAASIVEGERDSGRIQALLMQINSCTSPETVFHVSSEGRSGLPTESSQAGRRPARHFNEGIRASDRARNGPIMYAKCRWNSHRTSSKPRFGEHPLDRVRELPDRACCALYSRDGFWRGNLLSKHPLRAIIIRGIVAEFDQIIGSAGR
jgi:hypothetical protein